MIFSHVLQALRVSDDLQAGIIFVNTYNKTDVAAPFGGFKQSGFGKDLGKGNYNVICGRLHACAAGRVCDMQ